ncbi:AEC family transporter [Arthrobacter roseus]|uniref:AEC family transporter n=1 Tax=Arthrobacter roseus TaxID=136274 RepID=UPI001966A2BF|nr:AEC family transporter [Arthrobacter roseus]MBM7847842.1 putative permease [Arthrobacter roseus]
MFTEVLIKVLPLFLVVFSGYLASYWGRFRDGAAESSISAFVFYVALPALLFKIAAESDFAAGFPLAFPILILGTTAAFAGAVFVLIWFLVGRNVKSTLAVAMAASYGNVAYLGIPVIIGVLGEAGGLPAGMAQLFHNFLFMLGYPILYGLLLIRPTAGMNRWAIVNTAMRKAIFASPVFWGIGLGVLVGLTDVTVPAPVTSYIDILAGAAAPGALFAIGLSLRNAVLNFSGGELNVLPLFTAAGAKLLLLPAITAGTAMWLAPELPEPWFVALVLAAGMPTSATAFVLAQADGGDGRAAAATIVVTTAASIITLPLIAQLFIVSA